MTGSTADVRLTGCQIETARVAAVVWGGIGRRSTIVRTVSSDRVLPSIAVVACAPLARLTMWS